MDWSMASWWQRAPDKGGSSPISSQVHLRFHLPPQGGAAPRPSQMPGPYLRLASLQNREPNKLLFLVSGLASGFLS